MSPPFSPPHRYHKHHHHDDNDDDHDDNAPTPEQVHLALGEDGVYTVAWVDPRPWTEVELSREVGCVQWGRVPGQYTQRVCTPPTYYSTNDKKNPYTSGLLYHQTMTDVPPSTRIYYQVGSESTMPREFTSSPISSWSREFSFVSSPPLGAFPYLLGLAGDLGQTENTLQTLRHLDRANPQSVLHVGDLSYADTFQPRWDSFARLLEPYATQRGWMHTEGNHEMELIHEAMPFLAYELRYWVPHRSSQSPSKLYYSYQVGPVHVIMLGSYEQFSRTSPQHAWLIQELARVDRTLTPWVIAATHAPWYNSNTAHQNEYSSFGMKAEFEDLLRTHGVDIVFSGHVHAYERSHPVYQNALDPCAATYIGIGDGGNHEGLAEDYLPQPSWSAWREPSFGHGLLQFFNATHAQWRWVRNQDLPTDDPGDEHWIVRDDPACRGGRGGGGMRGGGVKDHHQKKEAEKRPSQNVVSDRTRGKGRWMGPAMLGRMKHFLVSSDFAEKEGEGVKEERNRAWGVVEKKSERDQPTHAWGVVHGQPRGQVPDWLTRSLGDTRFAAMGITPSDAH